MRLGLTICIIIVEVSAAAAGRGGADWLQERVPVIDGFGGVLVGVSVAFGIVVVAVSTEFAEET